MISACLNECIDITILKSNLSIVGISLGLRDDWYYSCPIINGYPENEMLDVCFENIYTDEIEGAEPCSYYNYYLAI